MDFFFKFSNPPSDKTLLADINSAANRLYHKLEKLNIAELNISDYNKKYLGDLFKNLKSSLQLRSYLLAWGLYGIKKAYPEMVLVDYGGGSGLLSLFAKELGIGKVIYDDIYDVSCKDAQIIASSIGNMADAYIHGDIDELIHVLKTKGINCDAIVSYDVIEHIYDINTFLKKLKFLSSRNLNIVMASSANILNPLRRRKLMKIQRKIEFSSREKKWGHKPIDSLRPYHGIRKDLIKNHSQKLNKTLTEDELEKLAYLTRGLIKNEIEESITQYFLTKEMPVGLKHPTNTCDPNTGNWAEHLLIHSELIHALNEEGFESNILSGFYGDIRHLPLRIAGLCLNVLISILEKNGLGLAPFYTLYAQRK